MCGIAGYVNLDPHRPAEAGLVELMTRTLVHRGPDDEGFHLEGPVALGARRLRIIDLEGGKQPITNEDRTVWIVFNGEIYNFQELRQSLNGRHHFTTRSDTEVIVHLYEEQGTECLEALRGMFAFALWDAKTARLLLARDHVGKKPLYYARTREALWFGSEIKALLAVPAVDRTLDPAALDDYLALGYVPAPRSIFTGIRKLPPATLLEVQAGKERVRRYWRLDWTATGSVDERTARSGLEERLAKAVARRLIADVPLGAFLSGGIDSTTVVWQMSRQMREPVKTFSIGFDDPAYDELPYARQVARAFRTEHYEQVVKPDVLTLLPELVHAFDEPFGDASAIPTYLVSQLARQHVTVALSGDGGDEGFAGYDRYRKMYLLERIRGLLLGRPGVQAVRHSLRALPLPAGRRHRLAAALKRAALPALERYCALVGLYTPDLRAALLAANPAPRRSSVPEALERAWNDATLLDPIRKLQAVDAKTYLPDDILAKVDRASMAVSLETRAPFLDIDLLQYAASLPTWLKFRHGRGKWNLRRLLEGQVPASVLSRPKRGFAIPLGQWLRENWRIPARELLLDGPSPGYFRRQAVEKILAEHTNGAVDHGERLWLLLVFAAWHDHYLGAV